MYPGFASIDQALAFVDFKTACDPGLGTRGYLRPEPVRGERARGGRAEWIFPPRLRKFSGKRLVVGTRFQRVEGRAYVGRAGRGRGRGNGMRIHPGSEFLVTARGAPPPPLYEAEG